MSATPGFEASGSANSIRHSTLVSSAQKQCMSPSNCKLLKKMGWEEKQVCHLTHTVVGMTRNCGGNVLGIRTCQYARSDRGFTSRIIDGEMRSPGRKRESGRQGLESGMGMCCAFIFSGLQAELGLLFATSITVSLI